MIRRRKKATQPSRGTPASRSFRAFRARLAATSGRPAGAVTYGFSTRAAGYPGFYSVLERRGPIAVPDQTHSDHVVRAAGSVRRTEIPDCDALVTTAGGYTLTVRTADCLPIFLWDSRGRAVAVAHAGWKGTHRAIAAKTVRRLKRLGVDPKNLRVVFGPAIRACCYEVGPEFVGRFDAQTLQKNREGRFQFDLALANRLQLVQAGVPGRNIRDLRLCTACDTRTFFSFRRDPSHTGRMIHWIVRD